MSYSRAVAELILAGALWGFGFTAAVWALESMTPLWATVFRFLIAFGVVSPYVFWLFYKDFQNQKRILKAAWVPGFLICAVLILQTWGLKYTTPTKSGFITTLYIMMVPILERLFLHRKLSRLHWIFVVLGLYGTALICDFHGGGWNAGDVMTLACAFIATLHILWIDKLSKFNFDAFMLNNFQSLWAGLLALALVLMAGDSLPTEVSQKSIFGLLSLSIFSTLIGFMIQVRTQKVLPASLASMLFLLESPFAAFFSFLLIGERFSFTQMMGAVIILIAAIGAIQVNHRK